MVCCTSEWLIISYPGKASSTKFVACWFHTARVVSDRISGYSKGFGFVRYTTLEDAAKGIEGMNGKVSFAIVPLLSLLWKQ